MADKPIVVLGENWMRWFAKRIGIPFADEIEYDNTIFVLHKRLEICE